MTRVRDYMANFDGSYDCISAENPRLVDCVSTIVQLTPSGRTELFDSMLRELPQQFDANIDMNARYWYIDLMLEMVKLGMEDGKRRLGEMITYFVGRMDQFMPDPFKKGTTPRDIEAWTEYNSVLNGDHKFVIYEAILSYPERRKVERDHTLGLIMKFKGMPVVANDLRLMMTAENSSKESKAEAMKVLGEILGLDEREKRMKVNGELSENEHLEVHGYLGGVYAKCNFAEYRVSLLTKEFRMRNLQTIFGKIGIGKEAKICDAGCGAGWLMKELMDSGYSQISGFDNDPSELAAAKALLPITARLSEGNLYSMHRTYREDPQGVVLIMGRTITHAETEDNMDEILLQAFGAIDDEKGGYLIFDLPDMEVMGGAYEENMEFYKNILKRYGFSDKELGDFSYIVDSPDGENFYNRLVPKIARAIVLAERDGFVPVKEAFLVEGLPNGRGDKNVVLVFKKLSEAEEEARTAVREEAWRPKPVKNMWES